MPDLDFIEQASVWALTGLLAVSGTPLAAIAFLTVAPTFIVAMRTGNLGGIIKWFVDGDPVATIDTYSPDPGIVEVTLAGDPDLSEHQIYAVKDDSPDTIAEIVRKRLSEEEVNPQGLRWNVDCSCVQQLVNGVWVDAPDADPRSSPGFQFPTPTMPDPACDAGARIAAAIENSLSWLFTATSIVEAVNAMIALVAVFFPPAALFVLLLFALVNAANAIGFSLVGAAFDSTAYADIACLVTCNIGADGVFDETEWNAFQDAIGAHFGLSPVTAILSLMFNALGMVGFNNMVAVGTETGDCDACACCIEALQGLGENGWTPSTDPTIVYDGVTTYETSPQRFETVSPATAAGCTYFFVAAQFTTDFATQSVKVHMLGAVTGGTDVGFAVYLDSVLQNFETVGGASTDDDWTYNFGGSPAAAGVITLRGNFANSECGDIGTGSLAFTAIEICPA